MTPTQLRTAGLLLYGTYWQAGLARALDVNERTIRRWSNGHNPIPPSACNEIAELINERRLALSDLENQLTA